MSDNCPVCKTVLKEKTPTRNSAFSTYAYDCPLCGKFVFKFRESDLELELNNSDDNDKRFVLSHNIRKMQKDDSEVILDGNLIKEILKKPLPSINEQANNLIMWFAENSSPGEKPFVQPSTHQSIIGAKNPDGFAFILKHLFARGLIDGELAEAMGAPGRAYANLTFDGWKYHDQLKRGAMDSRKAFMAMEYGDKELDEIVDNHFKPAVACTGFELCRLDERGKAGLIDDRLRVEIRNSRFLISDLTHENRGAYWEAGYAEGLGKPVIYTCEQKKFEEKKTHFDTNHHLTVTWNENNPQEAMETLKATIRTTLPDEAKLSDD